MILAAELAGFFAAHAIWCVSDGDTLIPILAYTDKSGKRQMVRLAMDELAEAVEIGKQRLASNEMDANDAAFLYDGYVRSNEEKLDAVIVELRTYLSPRSEATIAVPYTPKSSGSFRVHRPKLVDWINCEDFHLDSVLDAFFKGVDAHREGAAVWNRCLDESK